MKTKIFIILGLSLIASCQNNNAIMSESPDPSAYTKDVGRILNVTDNMNIMENSTSIVSTSSGEFLIYGIPTYKRYSVVKLQHDSLYIVNDKNITKKYKLVR